MKSKPAISSVTLNYKAGAPDNQDDGSLVAKGIHPDEGCIWSVHQRCLPVNA